MEMCNKCCKYSDCLNETGICKKCEDEIILRLKLKVKRLKECEKTFTEPFEVDNYVLGYLSDFDIKYFDDMLEEYLVFYENNLDVYLLLETEEENINENETLFSIKNIELYKGLN